MCVGEVSPEASRRPAYTTCSFLPWPVVTGLSRLTTAAGTRWVCSARSPIDHRTSAPKIVGRISVPASTRLNRFTAMPPGVGAVARFRTSASSGARTAPATTVVPLSTSERSDCQRAATSSGLARSSSRWSTTTRGRPRSFASCSCEGKRTSRGTRRRTAADSAGSTRSSTTRRPSTSRRPVSAASSACRATASSDATTTRPASRTTSEAGPMTSGTDTFSARTTAGPCVLVHSSCSR